MLSRGFDSLLARRAAETPNDVAAIFPDGTLTYAQLERPGSPMIFGSFLASVSMKSGAPMAGTSELGLMNLMIGQLARKYRLPWRSSGMLTGSKVTDAQAAYESAFNMFPILLAGADIVMHCAGWTEAGLTASYAKFMLDAEQMEMLYRFLAGPRFEDFDEALATVRDVGMVASRLAVPDGVADGTQVILTAR